MRMAAASWSALCAVAADPSTLRLRRTPTLEARYERFRDFLRQRGARLEDVLRTWYFAGARGGEETQQPAARLVLNRFPYDVEDGITHHVLWVWKPRSAPQRLDVSFLAPDVERQLAIFYRGNAFEWLAFENPEPWRSVGGLPHLQVFSRRAHRTAPSALLEPEAATSASSRPEELSREGEGRRGRRISSKG